jgi:predicted membrane-bound mannosyltransferase
MIESHEHFRCLFITSSNLAAALRALEEVLNMMAVFVGF